MSNLLSFFIGVFSSLTASYILSLFGLFSKIVPSKLRKSFDGEFKNQEKALEVIRRDAKNSSTLCVLVLKGDTFSNPGPSGVLNDLLRDGPINQKYLISCPDNPFVEQRSRELRNNLKIGIKSSIDNFNEAITRNSSIEMRQHSEALRFRIFIFDNSLYLSFLAPGAPGRESPMQRYTKSSSGYLALKAYFEHLWEKYVPSDKDNDASE
ncbi:MAG: hypothetical protein J1E60_07695 [Christensenellaceae bacterium]|nr:hypothetical protein [Christensenellaceae bacterium]